MNGTLPPARAHDLPADTCPGSAPLHGVRAFAVHPYPVTCRTCDRRTPVAWSVEGGHECSRCRRLRHDLEAGDA